MTAVVLAAGAGSRFGGGKLLATLDGRPVLQHVLDRLAEAGVADVLVVLGDDADAIDGAVRWGAARRVRNPDPSRGLSSSLRVGIDALDPDASAALIVLGDQPQLPVAAIAALLASPPTAGRPIVVPVYSHDGGRNPVLVGRAAFDLVGAATGDRGLGPLIAAHPELVRDVTVDGENPDVDTRADLVGLLETAWAARVVANREQVDRVREVPDGADFYAPVTGLFRADPARTGERDLEILSSMVEPGETWLDIGAGAGRYALPIALALAPGGGSVIAVDPSVGMLDALRELAAEHRIANVRIVVGRWPPSDVAPFEADVSLIAHVGYDIEAIGPFVLAMEAATRRRCVAMLMERQPSSIADVCWPPVHGEARVALPALPQFVELLRAMGRTPEVHRLEREPRRFGDRRRARGVPAPSGVGPAGKREGRALPGRARRAHRDRRRRSRRAARTAPAPDRHRHLGAAGRPMIEEGVAPDGRQTVHPLDRASLRSWLAEHHATSKGAWIVGYRRATGKPWIEYEAVVEELLCVGWIDSTGRSLDDERVMQWVSPRKPRSVWSRSNRERVARLTAAGLMLPAGLAAVARAKELGTWTALDAVEDLAVPDDLAAAFEANPPAREAWIGSRRRRGGCSSGGSSRRSARRHVRRG